MTPKETLLAWHRAFLARDVEALIALYAEDAINHQVAEAPLQGKQAIRESFEGFFQHLPPQRTEIVNIFEDGEWAIWEWIGGPAGQSGDAFRGCGFFQVRDGKIILQRGYWDKLSFLKVHGLPLEDPK